MAYDARQITNWFMQRAAQDNRAPSIMSLLKLAYIAHGWSLEMRGSPLFDNDIEAWQYGPVIPDVYKSLRDQGQNPRTLLDGFPVPTDHDDVDLLEQIYKIYGFMSPFKLSELTHVEGGPWATARQWGGWYAPIPNDLIKSHYVSKRQSANNASA